MWYMLYILLIKTALAYIKKNFKYKLIERDSEQESDIDGGFLFVISHPLTKLPFRTRINKWKQKVPFLGMWLMWAYIIY